MESYGNGNREREQEGSWETDLGKGFLGDAVLRDKVRQEPSTEGSVNIIKQVAAEEQREWT